MIKRKDLLALSFYEKSPFTGSEGPMNYRVEKITQKTADGDGEEKLLQATIWPGPLCFSSDRRGKKAAPYRSIFQRGPENAGGMDERDVFLKGKREHIIM